MTGNVGRNERAYRKTCAYLRQLTAAINGTCALSTFNPECPKTFDWTLRTPHPYSFTVDHIIPRSAGGDCDSITNMQPAHRKCNEMRGNQPMPDAVLVDHHSEDWG